MHYRIRIGPIPLGVMMAIALGSPAVAGMNRLVQEREPAFDQMLAAAGSSAALGDTVWFGGGTGTGSVLRGGIWNWEVDSGEIQEVFLDGDFVGNEYRDGWTFEDRTTKHGPSPIGSPHFDPAGVYDFNYDATPQGGLRPGGFAHRATTHVNNGIDNGPDPLAGAWSLWIGTNLELNPEHCGWQQVSGYGDGWSQGIVKSFAVPAGSAGVQYALAFRHRYAVEAGHDTCWVEISFDGVFWDQVGSTGNPNGIFTGGDAQNPLPSPAGGDQVVSLVTWSTSAAGTLRVRFRLASDAFRSDQGDGGNYRYAWQLDNATLLRNGVEVPGERTDFESGYNGWQVATCEGFDFAITTDPNRPAGRIARLSALSCPPLADCPEQCGLENRIVLFSDIDDCDLGDGYMDSYITSPSFAIGGPSQPDLDQNAGRLLQYDLFTDGGVGTFEIEAALCYLYWPFNQQRCPFAPAGGHPGAGTIFNWSQTGAEFCQLFSQGTGAECLNNTLVDLSAIVPADADSVILQVGVLSQCRYSPSCDINDQGTPFYDNLRFGVYDNQVFINAPTMHRYSDNFPTMNGNIVTQTARADNAYLGSPIDGIENPIRGVRGDSAVVYANSGGGSIAAYLRFRVTPGPCQPNLGHPFFVAFPPGQWHEALMDTARSYFLSPGSYMTCFHEQDPHEGTFWTGTPPPVESCDDILPDGLFTPGTVVHYFYEARPWHSSAVLGTFPRRADGGAIGTTANFAPLWLESSVLPVLDPACNGTYAHNFLIVNDYASTAVPGMASVLRDRLTSTLASLGLEFDVYDVVGANWIYQYDGIGRREDRMTQQPRPPHNGATQLQLEPYDCIWYTSGLALNSTLTDQRTVSFFGGQPSNDQQKLGTWLSGCTSGANRLLILDGRNWAADIDVNTTNGPSFLANRGVDVLADDYSEDLANDDLRRCARIAGTALAPDVGGEIFGSGCPENYELDVLHTLNGGEALAYFVESLEDGNDPVNCADDLPRPEWHAVVRRATGTGNCQRSVAMSFPFADFYPPNCTGQCLFDDYVVNGPNAELVIDLFQWAGKPINPIVIGVGAGGAPAIEATLEAPRPNPAPRGPVIRYSISARGRVRLKVYDVGGRLVRTLVDQVQEPNAAGYEVVWDGTTDAGMRAGSGVYFYELDSPGFAASKKLVMLE